MAAPRTVVWSSRGPHAAFDISSLRLKPTSVAPDQHELTNRRLPISVCGNKTAGLVSGTTLTCSRFEDCVPQRVTLGTAKETLRLTHRQFRRA